MLFLAGHLQLVAYADYMVRQSSQNCFVADSFGYFGVIGLRLLTTGTQTTGIYWKGIRKSTLSSSVPWCGLSNLPWNIGRYGI